MYVSLINCLILRFVAYIYNLKRNEKHYILRKRREKNLNIFNAFKYYLKIYANVSSFEKLIRKKTNEKRKQLLYMAESLILLVSSLFNTCRAIVLLESIQFFILSFFHFREILLKMRQHVVYLTHGENSQHMKRRKIERN